MNKLTESNAWKGTVRGTKSVLKWLSVVVLITLIVVVFFQYFYTYSEGYRSGLLQKFSRKGTIFKTYEGEMILSSVASTRDVALASEKFFFTLINKDLIKAFDNLQGEDIVVHYKQKNSPLFFRGDSEYLVDSVRVRR